MSNTATPTGLAAGAYVVTVSESNGCTTSTSAQVNSTGGPTVTSTNIQPSCGLNNGAISPIPAGGTAPYSYDWAHIAGAVNTQNLTGLAPGTYTVTVTDAVSCSGILEVILIASTATPTASTVGANATCG